ncbi:hypothetical protein AMAG_07662 [Allomyces macrogynus ATCC 38327]|uniref:Uncharacterized protein n=1 Tax=Allomyces macrogynus (strain ATCC 38327) TaxID=578462 RepID=A0A0L0SJ93_ALLM3|nr:hypothetical protein AMAG_07662 [Allomyces macrogynus ATCC 38327]|eukprot:KNE62445.1 hypothetical protein AMAG_07662 [Allomyces macrogynus ATCC 38327]
MARKKRSSPRASFDARDRSLSPAPAKLLGSPLGGASSNGATGTSPSARTHAQRRGKQPDLDLNLAMQSLALSASPVSSPLTPRARRDSGRRAWSDVRATPPPPLNLAPASSPRTPSGTQWTADDMDDEFGLASATPRRSRRSRRTSGQLGTPPTPTPPRRGGGTGARNVSPPPSPLLGAAHMVDTDSDALDDDEDVVLATAAQRRRKAEQRKRKQQRKQQQQLQQAVPADDPADLVESVGNESSSDDPDRDELDFMHAQLQILCPWYLPVFDATRPMSKRALAAFAAVRTSRTGFADFDGLVPEGDTEAARAAAIDAEDALGVAMADQVPGSPVAVVTSVVPEAAGATLATAGAWCRYPSSVPQRRARSPPPRLRLPRVVA